MNRTLPPLPLKNGRLEIDNSFLESFITCPRKCLYANILKRTPAKDQPALNFGSAFHRAMEYRYTKFRNEPPRPEQEQEIYDKAIAPYFSLNPQPDEDHRTPNFLQELVAQYNKRFNHESFSLLTDEKGEVMCEQTFTVPLTCITIPCDTPAINVTIDPVTKQTVTLYITLRAGDLLWIDYVGRVDLIVSQDDLFFVLDFKTASSLGVSKENELKVSPQFEGYAWALQQALNIKFAGFIVRCVRTKEKPGTTRGGWDKWWDECFMSHKEYFRPDQLREWHENTIALVNEFFYHYSNSYMPQKKKACTLYGLCSYYDVCYLPADQREQMLNSELFKDNTWSPLKDETPA